MEDRLNKRYEEIEKIKSYLKKVTEEVSSVLQEIQWDSKLILERPEMVTCVHNKNHRIPVFSRESHERKCLLAMHGYSEEDMMLPEAAVGGTSIRLSKNQIQNIINVAAWNNPQFRRGFPNKEVLEPLTLDRLQSTYTSDERRAIHDAVVAAAPRNADEMCDLPLPSGSGDGGREKSRAEVLAELRDMKRRRAKYRGGGSRDTNFSHALRDLITTQMELYTATQNTTTHNESVKNATSIVIKQEPTDTIPTASELDSSIDGETEYDRSIDRNVLYRRDRSRSRSQEKKPFNQYRKTEDRRIENQRRVYTRSPYKDVKQEDRKYLEKSTSRQKSEASYYNKDSVSAASSDISKERSYSSHKNEKETTSRDTKDYSRSKDHDIHRKRDFNDSKYRSRDDHRSRRERSRSKDRHSGKIYQDHKSEDERKSYSKASYRRRDDRSSSRYNDTSKNIKRYYDM